MEGPIRPTSKGRWAALLVGCVLAAAAAGASAQTSGPDSVSAAAASPTREDCLECHGDDPSMSMERGGKSVPLYVRVETLNGSAHATLACVQCHVGFDPEEVPHKTTITPVSCGSCHAAIGAQHAKSLHGKAAARGDRRAPRCRDCHGTHDVLPVKDPRSPVAALRVPFLCGRCHRENFSEIIHGERLLTKGLVVAPNCASCHTPHSILSPTDPASSIARRNIAATCTRCHAAVEEIHRKVIQGELWKQEARALPACVDCHQPHKVRRVYYDRGMADADCMRCHADPALKSSAGRALQVHIAELEGSRHAGLACSQCHVGVSASRERACKTLTGHVDCSSCHAETGAEYQQSRHGTLVAKKDPNAPGCVECHGTHGILGKADPRSASFPTNVPELCARCHREGEKAARRYKGTQHEIIEHYTESIHGKGLLQSGLTVTATCTSCHTAHGVRPKADPASSVNRANIPATCGRCHHGIEEQFRRSVHATQVGKTKKELPVCSDCHTAHTITRTDAAGFRLEIMNKCGRCHGEIAKTYFETYHGKVSQLGYAKTAKCHDCHGAHDILPPDDPASHLSRAHVLETCRKCHAGATRRFAEYLTHATHRDPKKYPLLFWTFWGMVSLLIGTFTVGSLHTALWLPRALEARREREARARKESEPHEPEKNEPEEGAS